MPLDEDDSMMGGNGQCDLSHAAPVGGAEGFADGSMDDLAL
jgi:hypothetical protein